MNVKDILDYEIRSSWWASWVGFGWGQNACESQEFFISITQSRTINDTQKPVDRDGQPATLKSMKNLSDEKSRGICRVRQAQKMEWIGK